MSNRYKVLTPLGELNYGTGEVDLDLSPLEERDALAGGHLELVPRRYRVLSRNFAGGKPGDVITAAFLVDHERSLVGGGHIERVDPAPGKKKD